MLPSCPKRRMIDAVAGLRGLGCREPYPVKRQTDPRYQTLFEGAAGAIHAALGLEPSDIIVTKHRVDAFFGTDLEMVLRARDIDTLVLFGIATSGVVLSTLLHACDADYHLVVIADCCADLDAELHGALLARLFPQRAEVVMAAEFVQALQSK
jgi:nicotinamidase-related amidase